MNDIQQGLLLISLLFSICSTVLVISYQKRIYRLESRIKDELDMFGYAIINELDNRDRLKRGE